MVAVAAPTRSAGARAGYAVPREQVQRWFLRAGVFLLPLAYSPATYDGYALPKLLVARVLFLGLLALWLAGLAASGSLTVRRSALDLPIAAFLASAAVSTVLAVNPNVALFGTYSRYDGLLTSITYAGLFWLAVQAVGSKAQARALVRVLLASAYAAAVIAIAQSMRDSIESGTLAPAYGTLGQKNILGAFLVLTLPLACWELATARSWPARILAGNALAVIGLALALTFSRSAWVAGAGATAVLAVALARGRAVRAAVVAGSALVLVAGAIVLLGSVVPLSRGDLLGSGDRPVVWAGTLHLIATRPVFGYGPDNFGLVFPKFESTDLHQQWDKAHSEVLQIAATQGAAGVAAYLWLLAAFVRSCWRRRRDPAAWAVAAAFAGYEATLQLNFTTLAAAFPFWIFLAAAVVLLDAARGTSPIVLRRPALAAAGVPLAIGLCALSTVPAYLADVDLRAAVVADFAGHPGDATAPAIAAAGLSPFDAVYATEVGNLAFERGDWKGARAAYNDAAALGTFNPAVFRNLAIADLQLGLFDEAKVAAQHAVDLDHFDPANRALRAQFGP